jgi:hypothetical protein
VQPHKTLQIKAFDTFSATMQGFTTKRASYFGPFFLVDCFLAAWIKGLETGGAQGNR